MLVTFGRGQFNATNEIVATLGAIRANTGQLLDDETHILAAIAALPSIQFPADQIPVLAAAIANDIGTPVDEEKLATALSHDVIASLVSRAQQRLNGRRPGQGRTARTSR
jgi:hypothetical protein